MCNSAFGDGSENVVGNGFDHFVSMASVGLAIATSTLFVILSEARNLSSIFSKCAKKQERFLASLGMTK